MNNFARAHDRYLEPPEDDPICEDWCGEPLYRDMDGNWECRNKYCPCKFPEGSIEREMANALADYKDALETARAQIRRMKNELRP